MASIINTATGRCWASELYNPVPGVLDNVPSSNNYQVGPKPYTPFFIIVSVVIAGIYFH